MNQLIGFIPSARTLWLLAGGGIVTTLFAILVPTRLGIAIVLTVGWYLVLIIIAGIDAWRSKADRVQVSRERLGKLSIGRDNPVSLTIASTSSVVMSSRTISIMLVSGLPSGSPISGKGGTEDRDS